VSRSTTSRSSSGLNDGDLPGCLVSLQAPAELGAAHTGQADVEHDGVRMPAGDRLERVLGAPRFLHLDVHDLERRA
jgi:hypothetical protein